MAPSNSIARPPVFRINLDAPPRERYKEVINHFKTKLRGYNVLFNQIIRMMPFPGLLTWLAKRHLKKLYDPEETEEIQGIAEYGGLHLCVVISLNTFLDAIMACTSGGISLDDGNDKHNEHKERTHMVHFRTLDWDMEEMRGLVYEAEYIKGSEVIARAMTYAGYTGVLTGVR
jgi:hypothetical protein